jgi:hypothetical protein
MTLELAYDPLEDASARWDAMYRGAPLTDWELIPPSDMRDVVDGVLPLETMRSAIEIGCGRGMRALALMLSSPKLNRPDFAYTGLDQCPAAIAVAQQLASAAAEERPLPEPYRRLLTPSVPVAGLRLMANVQYVTSDLFDWLEARPPVDLVVDWMCFHEIPIALRQEYARLVASVCHGFFVVNLFSSEGASVSDLGDVAGCPKFQFSEEEVLAIFGRDFELMHVRQFQEDLDPVPRPSDGIVAAKRAYVFRRVGPPEAERAAREPAGSTRPR